MANLLNTTLSAGMLAGVTIITGGAADAAPISSALVSAHAQINLTTIPASVSGALVFDGFSGPGTLTGVIMTLISVLCGQGEGPYGGVAELSLGAGAASQDVPSGYSADFDITSDLMNAPNPFGVACGAGDFTGPTVSVATFLTQTSTFNVTKWDSVGATLEYVYTSDVPLPAALPLMAIRLGALGFAARRRGRQARDRLGPKAHRGRPFACPLAGGKNMTDANLAQACTAKAFGSPISTYRWPDADALNAGLAAAIMARETADRGVLRSNIGGWHSAPDLLTWDDPHVAEFKARLTRYASDLTALILPEAAPDRHIEMQMDAWANVSRDGDYNNVHDHPGALWSGVCYVAARPPAPASTPHDAMLELLDPRVGVNMLPLSGSIFEGRYLITPLPGLMVFFPSWMKHFVHPFHGEGAQVSISLNISIKL